MVGSCSSLSNSPAALGLFYLCIMKINELERQFYGKGRTKGFKFKQISSTNSGFIYEVTNGGRIYYEVFKRKINKRFAVVSYPGGEAFGNWAWTFAKLSDARSKLADIDKSIIGKKK